MTEILRDADGCEDTIAETAAETAQSDFYEDPAETPYAETDDGDPEIVEVNPLETALQAEKEKYVRLFAEFDNYRKRTAKEKTETYQDAVAKTVLELLPVVDNFERAMVSPCSDTAFQSGMEIIYRQLTELLKKLGVTEIESLQQPFDPNVHNAIRQVEDDTLEENIVCEVYQKGYMLGSRMIRPAMVSVANCS